MATSNEHTCRKRGSGTTLAAKCKRCVYDNNQRKKIDRAAYNRGAAERQRKKYTANPQHFRDKNRRNRLKRHYGLSAEQHAGMVEAQGGLCWLCGKPPAGTWKVLNVDHDHATGRIRRLLCYPCNVAIGYFQDSPELMRKAADYVEAHREDAV